MTTESPAELRATLARLTGPARTRPLLDLGVQLADAYWRQGLGQPAALPLLDEAVGAVREAYGYLEPGQSMRSQVASQLGWLVGMRHVAHFGAEEDREDGIRLLDEALSFARLPQLLQTMSRITLGQLLVSRVMGSLRSGDLMRRAVTRSGPSAADTADADRAVACFRQVLDGPSTAPEFTSLTRTLLTVAEAARDLVSGIGRGPGGIDLSKMMETLAALQTLQQQAGAARSPGPGLPPMRPIFDADDIARADPLDRPVVVLDGPAPAAPPRPRVVPKPLPNVDTAAIRSEFSRKLPDGVLDRGAALPDVGTVDELVALGASLVAAGGADRADHVLLAVALHLRSRVDAGGGWGAEDEGTGDARAAADSLRMAAAGLPAAEPTTVAMAFRLATLLDERQPSADLRARICGEFAEVTGALRTAGAGALLYPQPGGPLMLDAATGRLGPVPAGTTLPSRLLIAGEGFRPPGDSVVSYIPSGAQLIDLAGRVRRPLGDTPVFVANPRGDRESATRDALLLRRTCYRRSLGFGRTGENMSGTGTADEVRTRLGASMIHLGCGVTPAGALELAGADELTPAEIAVPGRPSGGGLAVLPPVRDGADALRNALLASACAGVVGWLRPVPDPVPSLMYFLLHASLVHDRRDPANAVQAVRRWMSDPDRKAPPGLPAEYETLAGATELADGAYRDALAHYGV